MIEKHNIGYTIMELDAQEHPRKGWQRLGRNPSARLNCWKYYCV